MSSKDIDSLLSTTLEKRFIFNNETKSNFLIFKVLTKQQNSFYVFYMQGMI